MKLDTPNSINTGKKIRREFEKYNNEYQQEIISKARDEAYATASKIDDIMNLFPGFARKNSLQDAVEILKLGNGRFGWSPYGNHRNEDLLKIVYADDTTFEELKKLTILHNSTDKNSMYIFHEKMEKIKRRIDSFLHMGDGTASVGYIKNFTDYFFDGGMRVLKIVHNNEEFLMSFEAFHMYFFSGKILPNMIDSEESVDTLLSRNISPYVLTGFEHDTKQMIRAGNIDHVLLEGFLNAHYNKKLSIKTFGELWKILDPREVIKVYTTLGRIWDEYRLSSPHTDQEQKTFRKNRNALIESLRKPLQNNGIPRQFQTYLYTLAKIYIFAKDTYGT